mmetsp:Transcript_60609/g.192388  ORF Transcript_60609/g.192388 Transcript_60609/m.192388 type:complete len:86 (+) Transcript_60609:430-687(+)
MHCSTIFQIANHRYVQAINPFTMRFAFFLYRIQVKKSLGRMFVRAITAIYHRDSTTFSKLRDGARLRMSHGNNIRITTEYSSGVV